MKYKVFIPGLLLLTTHLPGQSVSVFEKVDAIDEYIDKLPETKKMDSRMFIGRIDSARSTNVDDHWLIGHWHKKKLAIVYNEHQHVFGQSYTRFYVIDDSTRCIDVQYFALAKLGGPNSFERRFMGRYYYENSVLIYQKTEGTKEQLEERADDHIRLFNDFLLFESLVSGLL